MQVEIGTILEGKITGITKFGAFVQLPGGKTGMVHISEVSNSYVKEIADFLHENDNVKVKVLSVTEEGKISLSIKQCMEPEEQKPPQRTAKPEFTPRRENRPPRSGGGIGWQPKKQQSNEPMSFEDMISKFKQTSNDRMSDLKKNEPKRTKRGGGPPKN